MDYAGRTGASWNSGAMAVRRLGAMLLLLATLCPAVQGESRLGIIAPLPAAQMPPPHWQALESVDASPEILVRYGGDAMGAPFDFGPFEEDLTAFAERGFVAGAAVTAHIRTTPIAEILDHAGAAHRDRHSPFDPAFAAEWRRLHGAFLRAYGNDQRIGRVYVAPPSYFGEAEYFMGQDWADLKFLSYGLQARSLFGQWLEKAHGGWPGVADAWGLASADPESFPMPKPRTDAGLHTALPWLDFLRWRESHLRDLVVDEVRRLAAGFHGEVGIKFAVCDYTAMHGMDTARAMAQLSDTPRLVLHSTNAHSLPDLRYMAAIRQRYGASRLVIENDGNRFTRTELARILLNLGLSGADAFHFSHVGHLVHAAPWQAPSATQRVLLSLAPLLEDFQSRPPRSSAAFLHSKTTAWVRAPAYRNRDVSHAYDAALTNGGHADVRAYALGRWLCLPDVTGEQLVLDGGLEGRRMLIVPNTGVTVLPKAVRERILAWVRGGGVLVLFGPDAFGHVIGENGAHVRVEDWPFLNTQNQGQAPSFAAPPPWQPWPGDGGGAPALVRKRLGSGAIYLFADTVPATPRGPRHDYFQQTVPLLLLRIAREHDVSLPFHLTAAAGPGSTPAAPLALGYIGRDEETGAHRFLGGAYDERLPAFWLHTSPDLHGRGELVLVDERRVYAEQDGQALEITLHGGNQGEVYADPTNREGLDSGYIPRAHVTFDCGRPVLVKLLPTP